MASSCVLRATGKNFRVDEFLRDSSLHPVNVFRKGESNTKLSNWSESGLTVDVSMADNFVDQVSDAIAFVKENRTDLLRLKAIGEIEGFELDFGVFARDAVVYSFVFPSELILLLGEVSLEMELSIYPDN